MMEDKRFFMTDEEKKNAFIAKKYIKDSKPLPYPFSEILENNYKDLLSKYPPRK